MKISTPGPDDLGPVAFSRPLKFNFIDFTPKSLSRRVPCARLCRVYFMYIHDFSFPLSLFHSLICVPRILRRFSEPQCLCLSSLGRVCLSQP